MVGVDIWAFMSLALGLGLLHALDADHIIAVSALSCQAGSKNSSVGYCVRWAFGHGGALMVLGGAVLFLGMNLPEELSSYAEHFVGLVLILIGGFVLWDLYHQRVHVHFHHHDGLSDHAHWHSHQKKDTHQHNHAPVLVGMLHGVAGSAPLFVLLPLSKLSSPWLGVGYLLLFGVGVFLSMLIFGGVLGQIFMRMKQWGNKFVIALRLAVSFLSIGFGIKLLLVSV